MVSPLNSPPPSPPPPPLGEGEPVIEAGAAAQPQPEMKTTRLQLVGVRRVTDMPLTNRGDVKLKISETLGLLSSEVCSAIASMETKHPREDVASRLEPEARQNATGLDKHILGMVDSLLETIALDEQASITLQTPEGRPYAEDDSDDDMLVTEGARNLWLSRISSMRLYAKDNPVLNKAVELAMRFSIRPDSQFSAGNPFSQTILRELARELNLPITDSFIQEIYSAFEHENVAGHFEGLNILERVLLKTIVLNRFEFNEEARNVAQAFVERYPESAITPLLLQDEIIVTTDEGEGGAGGSDPDTEGATAGVSKLKF